MIFRDFFWLKGGEWRLNSIWEKIFFGGPTIWQEIGMFSHLTLTTLWHRCYYYYFTNEETGLEMLSNISKSDGLDIQIQVCGLQIPGLYILFPNNNSFWTLFLTLALISFFFIHFTFVIWSTTLLYFPHFPFGSLLISSFNDYSFSFSSHLLHLKPLSSFLGQCINLLTDLIFILSPLDLSFIHDYLKGNN